MAAVGEWAFGLVNCILYQAMYREAGAALDEELVRRYAVAMQVEPLYDRPMAEQVAALRAVLATDTPLASAFDPYEGQEPFGEAEFRDFLSRLADELESHGPWPLAVKRRDGWLRQLFSRR
ncbi:hypothetical protein OOK31_00535 [Streptomyces sp. NBC_00249]|uniref:hypothetical protein n=1 Tax=Streptomyces sp. NBC_00249 TaxID=2975690 RepID=UPI0022537D6A|nr:hypothetical protein [Streptomyces sp. NBC_00249]MCX5192386.1 hypothetical protein [Streptomyces sp. NBC_00249]